MALVQMAAGKSPSFDLRVIGEREVYWIHAGRENEVHVLSFFRRPTPVRSLSTTVAYLRTGWLGGTPASE